MAQSALDKVLALSESGSVPGQEPDSAGELVTAAISAINELRVLLAAPDSEDEGKGGDDHSGHSTYKKLVAKNVPPKRASTMCAAADKRVSAAALAEAAVIALSGLTAAGGDWVEATAFDRMAVLLADGKSPAKPYGNVTYADTGKRGKARYPVDTPEHTRAAWSYINQKDNARKYSPDDLAEIKATIKRAMKKHGIGGGDDGDKVENSYVVELAARPGKKAGPPMPPQRMHHGPFTGAHAHGHSFADVHEHDHFHNNDNSHDFHQHGDDGPAGRDERDW
jgi:hypothetical protein